MQIHIKLNKTQVKYTFHLYVNKCNSVFPYLSFMRREKSQNIKDLKKM